LISPLSAKSLNFVMPPPAKMTGKPEVAAIFRAGPLPCRSSHRCHANRPLGNRKKQKEKMTNN
jgi:hypothetical protein